MKTKTLITSMALTGALLAAASVAKANAYLEVISGSASQSGFINIPPNGQAYEGTVGSWAFDFSSGSQSGTSDILSVMLNTQASGNVVANGLTIIYASGTPYTLPGGFNLSESDTGDTLGATAAAYTSSVWNPPTLGTQLGTTLSLGAATGSVQESGSIGSSSYFVTEVLNIGGGAAGVISPASYETVNVTETLKVVPDGGTTLMLLGSAFVGVCGLRNRFSKRG